MHSFLLCDICKNLLTLCSNTKCGQALEWRVRVKFIPSCICLGAETPPLPYTPFVCKGFDFEMLRLCGLICYICYLTAMRFFQWKLLCIFPLKSAFYWNLQNNLIDCCPDAFQESLFPVCVLLGKLTVNFLPMKNSPKVLRWVSLVP